MSASNGTTGIDSMSYQELQAEFQKTEELGRRLQERLSQKRGADNEVDVQPGNKRSKKSPSDDLLCPITLELPFDPVTAEDGRVYERSAILSHFERNPTGLKSPITAEPMGRHLLPAIQTKNLIETLIETGAIEGNLANNWKEKNEERKQVDDLKRRAEGGDAEAMYDVGRLYANGEKGVTQDSKLSYAWYKKAADADSVKGMALAGNRLVRGRGVRQNKAYGMTLTVMAADRGSDVACRNLGLWFLEGKYDLPIDIAQATRWLRKCLSGDCSQLHLKQESVAIARSTLQALEDDDASDEEEAVYYSEL